MLHKISKEKLRLAQEAVTRVTEEDDHRPFGYDSDKAMKKMLKALKAIKREMELELAYRNVERERHSNFKSEPVHDTTEFELNKEDREMKRLLNIRY